MPPPFLHTRALGPMTRCLHRALLPRTSRPTSLRTLTTTCPRLAIMKRYPTPSAQKPRHNPPQTHDRGPASAETTQTDFGTLDVLGATPVPSTSIDATLWDGFHLNNGTKVVGGRGVLLVGGEAFGWCPWECEGGVGPLKLVNGKGQWEVADEAWGVLGLVWPKPDLLILGVGPNMAPLSPSTRKFISSLGIRVDISDTRNAAAQFNLLATERGLGSVAAALIPIGWREGVGVKSSRDESASMG